MFRKGKQKKTINISGNFIIKDPNKIIILILTTWWTCCFSFAEQEIILFGTLQCTFCWYYFAYGFGCWKGITWRGIFKYFSWFTTSLCSLLVFKKDRKIKINWIWKKKSSIILILSIKHKKNIQNSYWNGQSKELINLSQVKTSIKIMLIFIVYIFKHIIFSNWIRISKKKKKIIFN